LRVPRASCSVALVHEPGAAGHNYAALALLLERANADARDTRASTAGGARIAGLVRCRHAGGGGQPTAQPRYHQPSRRGQNYADREAATLRRRDRVGGRREGQGRAAARHVGLCLPSGFQPVVRASRPWRCSSPNVAVMAIEQERGISISSTVLSYECMRPRRRHRSCAPSRNCAQ
jgi:hypothetical protein